MVTTPIFEKSRPQWRLGNGTLGPTVHKFSETYPAYGDGQHLLSLGVKHTGRGYHCQINKMFGFVFFFEKPPRILFLNPFLILIY